MSTHAFTSARMSTSGSRTIVHPDFFRYAFLLRSFFICSGRECQYTPSTSTASFASGKATSIKNGPIWTSVSNLMPRIASSLCTMRSMLLVRGHVCDTQAPAQRREQNRNRDTSDGFTCRILPQNSQAIGTFGLYNGWFLPVIVRLWTLAQSREQNRAVFASKPLRRNVPPQDSQVHPTRFGSALLRPMSAHFREQYRAVLASAGMTYRVFPQVAQVIGMCSPLFGGDLPAFISREHSREQNRAVSALCGYTRNDSPHFSQVRSTFFDAARVLPLSAHAREQNRLSVRDGYRWNVLPQWAQFTSIMNQVYHEKGRLLSMETCSTQGVKP